MINIIVRNLLIIVTVLTMCGWLLMSMFAINCPETFNRTISLSDEIQETSSVVFVLNSSSNILKKSLNGDKNITSLNHSVSHISKPAVFGTTPWQLKQTLLEAYQITVNDTVTRFPVPNENIKIHNNFRYGINASNQKNSLKNSQKQSAPLSSNIKPVNSSNLTPSATSASPGATAAGFRPTNSKFTVSSYFERVEMHQSLTRSINEKLLLHRNKRYLLFPEGSSFQLVFDLIIPIVDYTNFAIMGITCAVAWELPSKPPSEIIENFRTKLNDGTFGLSRRNDSAVQSLVYIDSQRTEQQAAEGNKRWTEGATEEHSHNLPQLSATTATISGREHFLTYVSKPPLIQPSSGLKYINYIQREKNQQPLIFSYGRQIQQQHDHDYEAFDANQKKTLYANTNGKSSIYRNGFYPYANKRIYYKDLGPHPTQPKWWKYQDKPQMTSRKRVSNKRTGRNRKVLSKLPKHRIYPIFGKRRRRRSTGYPQIYFDNDATSKELHNIHTKEHLQTRLKLYGKVEKLYKTRGQNGTACVLRALCETERTHLNSYNEEPQSFVLELLRSIFALPTDILTNSKESLLQVDGRYVNAVFQAHDVTQTCRQQHNDCGYSIAYNTYE